jgi:hypothetical protein
MLLQTLKSWRPVKKWTSARVKLEGGTFESTIGKCVNRQQYHAPIYTQHNRHQHILTAALFTGVQTRCYVQTTHVQCTTHKFTVLSNPCGSFSLVHRVLIYQQIHSEFQFCTIANIPL